MTKYHFADKCGVDFLGNKLKISISRQVLILYRKIACLYLSCYNIQLNKFIFEIYIDTGQYFVGFKIF